MRFFDISATAMVATTALFSGAFAAVAPSSYDAAAAPPTYTSATTTYYTTRTVMRVVETLTATRNGTASASQTSTATSVPTLYPMGNDTATALATGAVPSASGVYEGSAAQISVGMVAFIGLTGLLL